MAFFIKTAEGLERVNGMQIKPSTIEKTIAANGVYNASNDGVDGYSAVTVNVPLAANGNLFDFTKKRIENGYRNHKVFDSGEGDPQTYELDMSDYAPTCYISEYIPVEAGIKYFLVRPEFTWRGSGIVIYNDSKEIISYLESLSASYKERTIPSGGAFVRFSVVDTTGISLTTCPEYERLVSFCRA